MEQLITHACGHEQAHYLTGFTSQQERKARWLRTTTCRPCFIASRKAEQAEAAQRDGAAIAHLDLPALVGTDRQVGWATTIRAGRMAALVTVPIDGDADELQCCAAITAAKWWIDHRDLAECCAAITAAKWWIDHRDLADAELLAKAGDATSMDSHSTDGIPSQA